MKVAVIGEEVTQHAGYLQNSNRHTRINSQSIKAVLKCSKLSLEITKYLCLASGKLTVRCVGPDMSEVPVQLLDKQDGTHSLKITPAQSGRHILHVLYGGEHVLGKRLHPHRKENIIYHKCLGKNVHILFSSSL